jgi:hypothetical protein
LFGARLQRRKPKAHDKHTLNLPNGDHDTSSFLGTGHIGTGTRAPLDEANNSTPLEGGFGISTLASSFEMGAKPQDT